MLALMIAVAAISGVARRFGYSYPIVLVLAGLAISFLPQIPRIPLPPNVVFLVFLPPLLFSAAWQTSWREFRSNIFAISLLAFGLVFFTAFGVAFTAHLFLPNFDWRLGFLLGAVVSPTDAVAASSIAKKGRHAAAHRRRFGRREPAERCNGPAGAGVWREHAGAGNDADDRRGVAAVFCGCLQVARASAWSWVASCRGLNVGLTMAR